MQVEIFIEADIYQTVWSQHGCGGCVWWEFAVFKIVKMITHPQKCFWAKAEVSFMSSTCLKWYSSDTEVAISGVSIFSESSSGQ